MESRRLRFLVFIPALREPAFASSFGAFAPLKFFNEPLVSPTITVSGPTVYQGTGLFKYGEWLEVLICFLGSFLFLSLQAFQMSLQRTAYGIL